ncbi:MAG: Alpha-galactosidase [Candidatus Hydrogenedentes bacterium]|nr:Alpha-galactosidase [Candidatus Hydrogenedentota bacterium]
MGAGPIGERQGKKFRTITTTTSEVAIRKNGRLDVTLTSGQPIFVNVAPMVWFDGEDEPEALEIDGRRTARRLVKDPLGEGHGMLYSKDNCVWTVGTYMTEPYLTVQVTYVNDGKKPVRVKALSPWDVGGSESGMFSLGPGSENAVVLENGRMLSDPDGPAVRTEGGGESLWNIAIYSAALRRTVVAGTLTNTRGYTRFRVARGDKKSDEGFNRFEAMCIYDPPVEVPPGGLLASEKIYLSVSEPVPQLGLDRYAKAVADYNELDRPGAAAMHTWECTAVDGAALTEDRVLAHLDFMAANLSRYGWDYFEVGEGWARSPGDWTADEGRFPHGMAWLVEQIHARGMKAGLRISPFVASRDAAAVQRSPQCFTGSFDDCLVADVTAPGGSEYVRDVCKRAVAEWGFDAISDPAILRPLLSLDTYADPSQTRIDAIRAGLHAVQEGLGPKALLLTGGPGFLTGQVADVVRFGPGCAPAWRSGADGQWGCVEAIGDAAHRYYFAPELWSADLGGVYVGEQTGLTRAQTTAWLTATVLCGGTLRLRGEAATLNAEDLSILRKLLPSARSVATPVDLFEQETPRVWLLPLSGTAGKWTLVGVFNWDETQTVSLPLPLPGLGLEQGSYYTVYDFWAEKYCGLAQDRLDVSVAPASCRLLGLREFEKRPMFVASNRHFSQGASDHKSIVWDDATRRLTGEFDAVADTDYVLTILVPEGYTAGDATVSAGAPTVSREGNALELAFHCADAGAVTWQVPF